MVYKYVQCSVCAKTKPISQYPEAIRRQARMGVIGAGACTECELAETLELANAKPAVDPEIEFRSEGTCVECGKPKLAPYYPKSALFESWATGFCRCRLPTTPRKPRIIDPRAARVAVAAAIAKREGDEADYIISRQGAAP